MSGKTLTPPNLHILSDISDTGRMAGLKGSDGSDFVDEPLKFNLRGMIF